MRLTIEEELICSKYMNVNGKNHCDECPLNLTEEYGTRACYATIDGRGIDIKRYTEIPDNVIEGTRNIAKYAGITMYQMSFKKDELGIPYHTNGKKFYAVTDELDKWRQNHAE